MSNVQGFNRDANGALIISTPNDRDGGQAGIFAPTLEGVPGAGSASASAVANRLQLVRVVPTRQMTITNVAFQVASAATADDPVTAVIVDGTTRAVVATTGSVTGQLNTVGIKTLALTVPITLVPGKVYYAGLHTPTPGGTLAFFGGVLIATPLAHMWGVNPPQVVADITTPTYPISGTVTFSGAAASAITVAWLLLKE